MHIYMCIYIYMCIWANDQPRWGNWWGITSHIQKLLSVKLIKHVQKHFSKIQPVLLFHKHPVKPRCLVHTLVYLTLFKQQQKQHVILFKHISNLSFLRISCKSSPFLRFRRLVDSNDHGMLSLYTTRKCTKSGQAIKGKDPSEKTHHLWGIHEFSGGVCSSVPEWLQF